MLSIPGELAQNIWNENGRVIENLRVIVPNHLDGHCLSHFRMTKPTFQMLCNEIGQLVSLVIQSHLPLSHCYFFIYFFVL